MPARLQNSSTETAPCAPLFSMGSGGPERGARFGICAIRPSETRVRTRLQNGGIFLRSMRTKSGRKSHFDQALQNSMTLVESWLVNSATFGVVCAFGLVI